MMLSSVRSFVPFVAASGPVGFTLAYDMAKVCITHELYLSNVVYFFYFRPFGNVSKYCDILHLVFCNIAMQNLMRRQD